MNAMSSSLHWRKGASIAETAAAGSALKRSSAASAARHGLVNRLPFERSRSSPTLKSRGAE